MIYTVDNCRLIIHIYNLCTVGNYLAYIQVLVFDILFTTFCFLVYKDHFLQTLKRLNLTMEYFLNFLKHNTSSNTNNKWGNLICIVFYFQNCNNSFLLLLFILPIIVTVSNF
jgi:hypothetical protein